MDKPIAALLCASGDTIEQLRDYYDKDEMLKDLMYRDPSYYFVGFYGEQQGVTVDKAISRLRQK